MNNVSIGLVTAGVGLLGVLLGTFLRPIVEDWFARRRETLHVIVEPSVEFFSPNPCVRMLWHKNEIEKLVKTSFRIENRTGRALRDQRIEFSSIRRPQQNEIVTFIVDEDSKAKFGTTISDIGTIFEFDRIEKSAKLNGSMLSTFHTDFHCAPLEGHDIVRLDSSQGNSWNKISTILAALSAALSAGALSVLFN